MKGLDFHIGFLKALLTAKKVVEANDKEIAIEHLKHMIHEVELNIKEE